jgi:integrase
MVRESSKTEKFKEAVDLLHQRRQEIKDGKFIAPKIHKNYLFNDLVSDYLAWAERQRSFRSKKGFIDQLSKSFNQIPLNMFTTLLIEKYQTERIQKGNKPATINRHIATIKHMFTKACDWGMIDEATRIKVHKVKLLKENNQRSRFLMEEECQNLIACCDQHLKPIVITALNTGMRKGEILNLKWDDIDFNNNFIRIEQTKNGEKREVSINDTLRKELEALRIGSKERPRRLDIPWVFYDPRTGKPYINIIRSFKTASKKAGIKDFVFHDLRHTFASHLVMDGEGLATVKELLGHKDIKMTLRYSHLSDSHKSEAVKRLDRIYKREPGSQKLHNFRG